MCPQRFRGQLAPVLDRALPRANKEARAAKGAEEQAYLMAMLTTIARLESAGAALQSEVASIATDDSMPTKVRQKAFLAELGIGGVAPFVDGAIQLALDDREGRIAASNALLQHGDQSQWREFEAAPTGTALNRFQRYIVESADSSNLEAVLEWNTRVIGELLGANPRVGNAIGMDWISSLEVLKAGSHDPSRKSSLEKSAQTAKRLLEEHKAGSGQPDKK